MRNLQYSSDAFGVNIWSSGTRRSMHGRKRARRLGRRPRRLAGCEDALDDVSTIRTCRMSGRHGSHGCHRQPSVTDTAAGSAWTFVGDLLQLCVASAHWPLGSQLSVVFFFRAGRLGNATYMIISYKIVLKNLQN